MIRLLNDREIRDLVEKSRTEGAAAREAELEKLAGRAKEEHDWTVRRLEAQLKDANIRADRYREGYRAALTKLKGYRGRLSRMSRQLVAAGLSTTEEPQEQNGKKRPKQPPMVEIMDAVMDKIPGMDDVSQEHTRAYIERELRRRGADAKNEIYEEVMAGGLADD